MTHPRRAWQGVSSGDGDRGSAAGCCLAQEGSTPIQALGSDLPSHSSPEFRGNGPTTPPSRVITRLGTPGLTPTGKHLHPCGPERARVGGRSPKGSRAASPIGGHHPNVSQQGIPRAPHGGDGSPRAVGTARPGSHGTLHALPERRAPSHGKTSPPPASQLRARAGTPRPRAHASCSSSPAAYHPFAINTVITDCDRTGQGGGRGEGRGDSPRRPHIPSTGR